MFSDVEDSSQLMYKELSSLVLDVHNVQSLVILVEVKFQNGFHNHDLQVFVVPQCHCEEYSVLVSQSDQTRDNLIGQYIDQHMTLLYLFQQTQTGHSQLVVHSVECIMYGVNSNVCSCTHNVYSLLYTCTCTLIAHDILNGGDNNYHEDMKL